MNNPSIVVLCSLLQLCLVDPQGDADNLHCCKSDEDKRIKTFTHWFQVLGWDSLYPHKVARLELVGKFRQGQEHGLLNCLIISQSYGLVEEPVRIEEQVISGLQTSLT